jgi:uncharacterized protein YprB with RNaseH-like and TPR domain
MLKNTFIHLPHIGRVTEERLWKKGINTWQDIINEKNEYAKRFSNIQQLLNLSELNLKNRNVRFFTDRLVADQQWRVYPDFKNETVFLDIETTGLKPSKDYITTISLYDGQNVKYYVHDKDIDQFKNDIKRYKILVTFNGKCFDVPFIEQELGIKLPHAHLDLRYILKSIGFKGGLKSCEHQLGFNRGDLEGVDGYFAVFLWKDYLNGNKKALETLLAYNIEDTVNLERLLYYAMNKKFDELKKINPELNLKLYSIEKRRKIDNLPKPDLKTINKLIEKYY